MNYHETLHETRPYTGQDQFHAVGQGQQCGGAGAVVGPASTTALVAHVWAGAVEQKQLAKVEKANTGPTDGPTDGLIQ